MSEAKDAPGKKKPYEKPEVKILPIDHVPERPDSGKTYRLKADPSIEIRVFRSSRSWVDYQNMPSEEWGCESLSEFMERWEKGT